MQFIAKPLFFAILTHASSDWLSEQVEIDVRRGQTDVGVRRGNIRRTSTRQSEMVGASGKISVARPRTAILLIGQLLDYKEWFPHFLEGMVSPTAAHIFIHSEAVPSELHQGLGDSVKAAAEEPEGDCKGTNKGRHPDCQFWHLAEAWRLMEKFENTSGFQYDVVVKARTGMAPMSPSYLSLAGWETPNRIHMMSDLIFWGPREDMAHVARYYEEGIRTYYKTLHPDAFQRPINVKALLDSYQRDVRLSTRSQESWRLYTKLDLLHYPDMGRRGAIANLEAAVKAGMETVICDGAPVRKSLGMPPYNRDAKRPALSSIPCKTHCSDVCQFDEDQGTRAENDLPDWVISHGMTVCDVGAQMKRIYVKGVEWLRSNASDCVKH